MRQFIAIDKKDAPRNNAIILQQDVKRQAER
jgi:hypothetical protein